MGYHSRIGVRHAHLVRDKLRHLVVAHLVENTARTKERKEKQHEKETLDAEFEVMETRTEDRPKKKTRVLCRIEA